MGAVSSWQAAAKRGSDHYIGEAATNDPQQQKMKDCAGKWRDEKTKTGGRAARPIENSWVSVLTKAPA